MNLRLNTQNNKAYLLIELMIVVVILGLAICFIAQAFSSSLSAVRKANIYSRALIFAEGQLWERKIQPALGRPLSKEDFPASFKKRENNINFESKEEALDTEFSDLLQVVFNISWRDSRSGGGFSFSTFMPTSINQ